jgi:ribulose-phosphate 3-epimerase
MLDKLRNRAPLILPSMLLCDFGNLEREVRILEEAGIEALHLDVMDGQFVPNFTYGMTIVQAFRSLTELPLDVHLMMVDPLPYLGQFQTAGADLITVHAEAVESPKEVIAEIKRLGVAAGIAINPSTPVSRIEDVIAECDLALVMSVPAGFGGQPFHEVALEKLNQIREMASHDIVLEVDGGVNMETIGRCAEAGATWFVAGSAIFCKDNYALAVADLARAAR